jgi:hypothetical protein
VQEQESGEKIACQCCGQATIPLAEWDYEICSVCDWEQDPIAARSGADPNEMSFPNHLPLLLGKAGYEAMGQSGACHVISDLLHSHKQWKEWTGKRLLSEEAFRHLTIASVALREGKGNVAKLALEKAGLL